MRKSVDWFVAIVSGGAAVFACTILLGLVAVIAHRGAAAVDWQFLTGEMRQVGARGGILYHVIGTFILIGTAFAICAPVALAVALLIRVYVQNERTRRGLALFLYTLNGVPSILFGIFGFVVFVKWFGWGKSWLAGGILLAAMIVPTVTVALVERMKALPSKYVEAATALGLTRAQVIWAVIVPQSWSGLLTGSLLGLARAAGETAPIMFTATIFAGASIPDGIKNSPVLSLPYHIFNLAQDSFDPAVGPKLWGTALVLLALVFVLSLIALPGRLKLHEEANV